MKKEISLTEALQSAYQYLKFRSFSEQEMRDRLNRKKFSEKIVDDAILQLKSEKLINDAQFAGEVAEFRMKDKNWSNARVEKELADKGVDPVTIHKMVAEASSGRTSEIASETERAYNLLLKRGTQFRARNLDEHTQYRRLYEYLARQGFDLDCVERAMSRYKREGRLSAADEDRF